MISNLVFIICILVLTVAAVITSISFVARNKIMSKNYIRSQYINAIKETYDKYCEFSEQCTVAILPREEDYEVEVEEELMNIALLIDMEANIAYSIARKGTVGEKFLHTHLKPGGKVYELIGGLVIASNKYIQVGDDEEDINAKLIRGAEPLYPDLYMPTEY